MMTLTCLQCYELLEKPTERKKFCNRSCQGKFQGTRGVFKRKTNPQWADEEIEVLRYGYELNIPVDVLAAQLGRSTSGVYLKASRLKFTDPCRKKRPEEVEQMRTRLRVWWQTLDRETVLRIVSHSCSEETRQKLSASGKLAYVEGRHEISDEERQSRSDRLKIARREDLRFGHPGKGSAGKRDDIGFYVRSRWEANYARYLILLKTKGEIIEFEYEPKRFEFVDIKRGTRSYLPDFWIRWADERVEYHEVKGYWTAQGKTAVKRFRARYPKETLVIIDAVAYQALATEWASQLSEWET